jgi:uncharacterized protein YjiS (DUF1127 family)
MSVQFVLQNDVVRRNHARRHGLHDHLIRTAEMRRLQAEAITNGVHWVWTNVRRIVERLMNGKAREGMPAANGRRIVPALGRATVVDALRRDLLRLVRVVRRSIVEPYARRRRRRIAIAHLEAMDDRLLADIGLRRSDIELAADGMLPRGVSDFVPRVERSSPDQERCLPAEKHWHELPLAA